MTLTKRTKRGFTLVELVVVLGVIAIVSTIVASYATVVRNTNKLAINRLDATNELQVAESVIENWLERNPEASLEDGILKFADDSLSYSGSVLIFGKDDDKTSLNFEFIEKIEFKVVNATSSDNKLFICTITYEVTSEDTYTFCVDPFVGETIAEVEND